jgi:mRNA interferase YafQ
LILLVIKVEKSFKKDIARDKKSGQYSEEDFNNLKTIIGLLQNQQEIDNRYRRHPLKGKLKDLESIHIKNDWLLIFNISDGFLNLIMLGKHTQVYKKFR